MSGKTWAGIGLAAVWMVIFGMYVLKGGCNINGAAAWVFGGGALFCGILIDPAEFKSVLSFLPIRKKPE